ncbi:MAG: NAD(P)-dependent oxidoreductase [Melioribacteraceae bacterium]|nr:NAD(P)-dependent oxidoreductase [Melioribacteraceae bacterium]
MLIRFKVFNTDGAFMNIFVSGATGYIGSNLAERLIKDGHNVVTISRDKSKVTNGYVNNFKIIHGDIRDAESIKKAFDNIDLVYHFAGVFRTPNIGDQDYWDVHVEGTKNLLNVAFENKVKRFIHCSTIGVHGHIEEPPAIETYRFNPGDTYQITKAKGEEAVRTFCEKNNFPFVVIRPTSVYGEGDMRMLKLFKLAKKKLTPILGKGELSLHLVHIKDLVEGFVLAADNEEALGESIFVGGDKAYTLNDLVDIISEILSVPKSKIHIPVKPFQMLGTACEKICIPLGINPPIYRRRVDFFTKNRSFDISKSKRILKYQPKVSLKEGLTRTAEWYKANSLL